jgi:hypothetical protein
MWRLRVLLIVIASVSWLLIYAANPAGIWGGQLTTTLGGGEVRRSVRLALAVDGSKLTGTLTGEGTSAELLDGTIRDDEVSFAIASGASDIPKLEFHGRLDGNALRLTVTGRVKDTEKTLKLGEGSFKRIR